LKNWVLILVLWLVFVSSFAAPAVAEDKEAKYNLHRTQLALERWAADNPTGEYPADLYAVLEAGYLTEWPDNPYLPFRKMLPTKVEDFVPGGIIYVPYEHPYARGGFSAYYLAAYGAVPASGLDLFAGPANFNLPQNKWQIQGDGRPEGIIILLASYPEPRGIF